MYPKKIALIDVGTLKVKIELREYHSVYEMKVLYKDSIRTALGRDWKNNSITHEAVELTISTLIQTKEELSKFGHYELKAIGTEALRKANNGADVLRRIKLQTGIELELLTQTEEAELFFKTVSQSISDKDIVSLDVGGGSVQVVFSDDNGKRNHFLFSTGTYAVRTKYIDGNNPTRESFILAQEHIFKTLLPLQNISCPAKTLILGSTIALDFFQTILPAFSLPSSKTDYPSHPLAITVKTLEQLLAELSTLPYPEREKIFIKEPAYTWGVDITIIHALVVCKHLNLTEIIPSNLNVSSGLFSELNLTN